MRSKLTLNYKTVENELDKTIRQIVGRDEDESWYVFSTGYRYLVYKFNASGEPLDLVDKLKEINNLNYKIEPV